MGVADGIATMIVASIVTMIVADGVVIAGKV